MKPKRIKRRRPYLEWLKIKNYQGHVDTSLDFSPGVNVFFGITDVGKSSIQRSVKSWVFNRWPKDFRKGYKKPTTIQGKIGNRIVERIKSGSINEYVIDGDYSDPLQTVDKKVPEEVKDILNFGDINFQGQGESPYLLGDNAGAVAKMINKITRMEELDEWVSTFSKKLYALNSKHEVKVSDLNEEELKLVPYKIVPLVKEDVAACVGEDKKLQELEEHILNIEIVVEELEDIKIEIDNFVDIEDLEQRLGTSQNMLNEIKISQKELDDLISVSNQLESISNELKSLDNLGDLELEAIELSKEADDLQAEEGHLEELEEINYDLSSIQVKLLPMKGEIELKTEEFFDLLKSMKVCPLCERKITDREDFTKHSLRGGI